MIYSVSPVHFGNHESSSIQTLLHRDGEYARKPSQKVALSNEKPEKELSTGTKTLIGLAAAVVIAAGYLGYAVKSGKLEKISTPEGITDRIKNVGFTIGETVKGWYDSVAKMFTKTEKTTTA